MAAGPSVSEDAFLIVMVAGDELGLQLGRDLEVGMARRFMPKTGLTSSVSASPRRIASTPSTRTIGRTSNARRAVAEIGGLGHERQRDDRCRHDRQKDPRTAEHLAPGHASRRQEAPVLGRQDLDAHRHGDVVGWQRRRGRALVHCPSFAAYGRLLCHQAHRSGDPDDPAVTGDDAADPVPGVMRTRRGRRGPTGNSGSRPRRVSAHTFRSPSDTYTQSGSSNNAGCTAESATRSATVGLEAKRHVSRVVAGRRKRRDSRSELHVTVTVSKRSRSGSTQRQMCGRSACVLANTRGRRRPRHASIKEEKRALEVRIPAQVIDVQVREEDEVDAVAGDASSARATGSSPSSSAVQSQRPGGPTPVSTR